MYSLNAGVVARLHGLLQDTDTVGGQVAPKELVIDGKTLAHILGRKSMCW